MNSNSIPSMAATAGSAPSSHRPSPTSSVWWPPAPPLNVDRASSKPQQQQQEEAQATPHGQAPRRTTSTTRKPTAAATAALAPANLVSLSPTANGTGQMSADARVRAVAAMGMGSESPTSPGPVQQFQQAAATAFPPPRSQPIANPPTAAGSGGGGATVHVYSNGTTAPNGTARIATPPTPHMQHYPIHMQQHMYQHHQQQQQAHPGAGAVAAQRPAVSVPQFSSQSSLVPPQHLDDDADSDIGQPPSQPFMLPPGTRPSPSDFDTISRHLSLGRTPHSHAAQLPPPQAHAPAAPTPSPEDMRAMQADAHIQNGIQLHERLQLTESTREFERAAHLGSATGMYLYGMALRSAWGVERDEKKAFEYLSRAADLALRQTSALQASAAAAGKSGAGASAAGEEQRAAAARELTLAIYELGQSFRNGWGVKKCRRTGAHYLQIAANLGDPDAQVDCGLAYLNGDGVKRDKMAAAKYFRLASNAGIEFPGNSWIWKDKYDITGVVKKVKAGAAAAAPAK